MNDITNDIARENNTQGNELYSQTYGLSDAATDAVWCESAGDFTLPDYMPEIGKMLKVEPRIIPSGKYIGSDRAEFSGSVVYSVLYTGDDGVPFYTTLSGDYEYTVPLGEASDCSEIEIYDEPTLESVSVRPSGPRKLSVRTRIKACPHILYRAKAKMTEPYDSPAENYQKLCQQRPVMSHGHFESGEFELSDVFKLDGSPDAAPVGCEGRVCISELVPSLSTVVCRGEVEYRVLYFDIEGGRRRLFSTGRKLRFEKEISCKYAADVTGIRAYGRIVSTDMEAAEDSSDIALGITLNIYGECSTERQTEFLRDIYSCSHACDVAYTDTEYRRDVLTKNLNFSYHAQKKLPEDIEGSCSISAAYGTARIDEVSVTDGHAHIAGEISVDCILCVLGEDTTDYSLVTVPIPFKCEVPVANTAERYDISIMPEVSGIRTRVEKDSITADAELYLSVFIGGVERMSVVKSVTLTDTELTRPCDTLTVYYPDDGETLWSVGKKYAVSIDSLRDANSLAAPSPASPDSLEGVRSLLII